MWIPTPLGWLALALAASAALVAATLLLYPFLARDQPTRRGILVVEGWIAEESLFRAIDAFRSGDYRLVVATGGAINGSWSKQDRFKTYAERAAHFMREHGVEDEEVVTLVAGRWHTNRTWQTAQEVQRWFSQSGLDVDALDVFSEGPHSRRSWLLYRRALGDQLTIGVFSAPPTEYDPRVWWQSSSGTKAVVTEAVGLAWVTCCLEAATRTSDGGIGITIYSQYPQADGYYRLRRYGWRSFQLDPHPDNEILCSGERDTGVIPQPNTWYHFRFQVLDNEQGTRLRAKIWAEEGTEPADWQIDCVDEEATFTSGKPGLWAMGPGIKLWDDLEVRPLDAANASAGPLPRNGIPRQSAPVYFEDFEGYGTAQNPAGWIDTGVQNSLKERPSLFMTRVLESRGMSFGTGSDQINIHSHLAIDGSSAWRSYEFSGLMAIADGGAGLAALGPDKSNAPAGQ